MSFTSEATEFRMQCIFWQIRLWRFIKIKLTKRSIILVSRLIQPDIWSDNRLNCHNSAKYITKTTLTKESGAIRVFKWHQDTQSLLVSVYIVLWIKVLTPVTHQNYSLFFKLPPTEWGSNHKTVSCAKPDYSVLLPDLCINAIYRVHIHLSSHRLINRNSEACEKKIPYPKVPWPILASFSYLFASGQ